MAGGLLVGEWGCKKGDDILREAKEVSEGGSGFFYIPMGVEVWGVTEPKRCEGCELVFSGASGGIGRHREAGG